MSVVIQCPACDTQLKAADDKRGKQIRCPKCQEVFRVPSASSAAKRRHPDDDDDTNARFSDKPVRPRRPRDEDDDDDSGIRRRPQRSRRDDDDFDDEPRARRKTSSALPWILAGSGAGVLLLAGIVLGVVLLSKKSEPAIAKAAPRPENVQAAAIPGIAVDPAAQPAPAGPVGGQPAQPPDGNGAPPAGWKLFAPKDNSFSVWLPEKPGRRGEHTRNFTGRGMRLKLSVVQLKVNGGAVYSAATIILSANVARKIPLQQKLEIMRDAFLQEGGDRKSVV
jgi:predicted Zn finger-like uncharacterized protein